MNVPSAVSCLRRAALSLALAVATATALLWAQPPQPALSDSKGAQEAKRNPKKRTVDVAAPGGEFRDAGDIQTISKGPQDAVKFTSEDVALTTEKATYNKRTSIASSPGKLVLEDTFNTLTGNSGVAYFKTREAVIRGNVTIVARPKGDPKNAQEGSMRRAFDSPVTITCDRVDYNWRTRIAVATGNLTMRQKERVVTAKRAVYDAKQEKVTLEDSVVYKDANGNSGRADIAIAYLKEGAEEFIARGNVQGSFDVEDEEETLQSATASPTPSGGSAPGPQ